MVTGQVFVGCRENLLVETALKSLLESSATGTTWPYNPLVLCGSSGSGKSLVANCLTGRWIRELNSRKVVITTGADFRRSFSQAVSSDNVEVWRSRCRSASLMMIDDIHQLRRATRAQRELVLLLDDLAGQSVPIIGTLPTHPAANAGLLSQLTSRLSMGLTIEVQAPGAEARLQILKHLLRQQPFDLSESALCWFAKRYHGNVPSLRNRLQGSLALNSSELGKEPIDRQTLKQLIDRWESRQNYSIKDVTRIVGRYCQVSRERILGSSRKQPIVLARSIAMFLCKELFGFSLRDIGHFFGGRDRSTVLHACQKIERLSKTDPPLRLTLDELRRILANDTSQTLDL